MPHPTIAVIIPVLNEADILERSLTDVASQGFDEIIVVDGGSDDGSRDIAQTLHGVTFIDSPKGRGTQLAAGVAVAKSDIILMLHADVALPTTAHGDIVSALSDHSVAGGSFRIRFRSDHILLRFSGWASRFETPLTTFGDQAFFLRRETLRAVGGVPTLPLLEDVVLRRALKSTGRFVKCKSSVTASARRFRKRGVASQQLLNAIILTRFALGASPNKLAELYK